ncbi:MAG TPA: globin [Rhodoblastus sp.]|nr:globin [Rhodoblastus sp.]
MRADLITHSLELAAARAGDLTPLVYARLFAERPELAQSFGHNAKTVHGEMLARALETILDFIGDSAYAANLVAAESAAHATYDVPPDTFVMFFRVIADTLRDALGADWTDETDAAWRDLVAALSACVTEAEGVSA